MNHTGTITIVRDCVSLVPRPLGVERRGKKRPGIHCLRMRQNVPKILVHRKLFSKPLRIRLRNPQLIFTRKDRRRMDVEVSVEARFSSSLSYALSCLKCEQMKLKDKQVEAIRAVYDGEDVLPTGYGKSVCYQAIPFLFDHKLGRKDLSAERHSVCIVVSPLISLMVDQVPRLRSVGVRCAILSGSSGVDKSLLASVQDVRVGGHSLLFTAPEAIVHGDHWRSMLSEEPLHSRVVALEAHCVYKWGTDSGHVMPEFMNLGHWCLAILLC